MSALGLRPGLRLAVSPRRRGSGLPPLVGSGLVAELRFDDGAGQQLTDFSGEAHHGTLGTTGGADAADPTWQTGPLRLELDGGDVVVTDDIDLVDEVHIELIARLDAASASTTVPAAIFDGNNNSSPFQIFRNGTNDNMLWRVGVGAARVDITGAFDVWDGGWHHLVLDVEEDGGAQVTAFLDELADGSGSGGSSMASAIQALTLGARNAAVDLAMTGAEAYCLLYNRHLTDAERAQNRKALVARMSARGVTLPANAQEAWSDGTLWADGTGWIDA